ncbi:hypothetical protein Efla_001114 [Eimeria flavescens]
MCATPRELTLVIWLTPICTSVKSTSNIRAARKAQHFEKYPGDGACKRCCCGGMKRVNPQAECVKPKKRMEVAASRDPRGEAPSLLALRAGEGLWRVAGKAGGEPPGAVGRENPGPRRGAEGSQETSALWEVGGRRQSQAASPAAE